MTGITEAMDGATMTTAMDGDIGIDSLFSAASGLAQPLFRGMGSPGPNRKFMGPRLPAEFTQLLLRNQGPNSWLKNCKTSARRRNPGDAAYRLDGGARCAHGFLYGNHG